MRAVLVVAALAGCRHDVARAADPELAVAVDRRIELFSILERLAGSPEYTRAETPYARAADVWFAPVNVHPAVLRMRALRAERGISYDAALTLAVQLDDHLVATGALDPLPEGLDARWNGVDLEAALGEVRAFADAGKLDAFRASQASYAAQVEDRLRAFVQQRPLVAWFDGAFGARAGARYRIAPGLLTGAMSYGLHAGALDIIEVIGLEASDAAGLPVFGAVSEALLAHELAHSYVNPMVHACLAELGSVEPALAAARPAMTRQHYTTTEIVLDESIVRAITILYLRDRVGAAAANASLAEQLQLGFTWEPALVDALDAERGTHLGTWTDKQLVAATRSVLAPVTR